jgi:cytochrome c oxidase cbb3-type subunit III
MAVEERDPVSGRPTTGHEWNGIKELDTPVPRGVLIFIIVTHVWALLWWILMPTWPLLTTYTKGILNTDQRKIVEQDLTAAQAERAAWMKAIETSSFEEIQANENLMKVVRTTGHQLFGDNCAACHGADGKGRANYPDLTDDDWLWGGEVEKIAETMRLGINSRHQNTRVAQMPAFGRDAMLDRTQVTNVATYVQSLSNPAVSTPQNVAQVQAGREVFLTTCAACHGEDGKGNREVGAPI